MTYIVGFLIEGHNSKEMWISGLKLAISTHLRLHLRIHFFNLLYKKKHERILIVVSWKGSGTLFHEFLITIFNNYWKRWLILNCAFIIQNAQISRFSRIFEMGLCEMKVNINFQLLPSKRQNCKFWDVPLTKNRQNITNLFWNQTVGVQHKV